MPRATCCTSAPTLAQVGHLVDEGDLHRQEGVGRVLDQFAGPPAGEDDRRLVQAQRAIELAHHRLGALVLGADHDAVGALEVLDRRAFAQELGVGDHGELGLGLVSLDDRLDLVAGADRHGRLGDDDGEAVDQAGDLLGGSVDVERSAWPSPRRVGVPTAMNTASAP
jgi:hypothetical protein